MNYNWNKFQKQQITATENWEIKKETKKFQIKISEKF